MSLTVEEATLVLAILKNLNYKLSPDLLVIQSIAEKLDEFLAPHETRQPNVQDAEEVKGDPAHGPTDN